MADRFPELSESNLTSLVDQKNSARMIKQLLNSVIAKYRDLSVASGSIIQCRSRRHSNCSIIVNFPLDESIGFDTDK